MGKRYYWLKLKDDFFSDKRIKKLRRIAGGDTYTIIYLKMMLSTLCSDGIIEFEGVEESLAEELALELDEDPDNVQITLEFLIKSGLMVEIDNNNYELPMVKESTGSETSVAKRVREYRERQKVLQCNTEVTDMKQLGNVEIEKREKRKEIENREEIEGEKREITNYKAIADLYNEICISFPRLVTLSDPRKKAIKARLNQYSIEDFEKMFKKAEASTFLKGGNNRNWSATFDWMIKDANMAKILEGNYDNKVTPITKNSVDLDSTYAMMAEWSRGHENEAI